MRDEHHVAFAAQLMRQFSKNTGLVGEAEPRRYLWTDSFAVCNLLELHACTGEREYLDLALHLVDQVHQVLGRHRGDDRRSGWLSGLDEEEGRAHPTAGGLRIGKELPERKPEEPFDQQLEWERDGQYFHYLTKWMHALRRVSSETSDAMYSDWACELASKAHQCFTYESFLCDSMRMYWKMSIDLAYPLVNAMGHHDPLDGYLTFLDLQCSTTHPLPKEIAEMEEMCRHRKWTTDDPLGLGGILCDSLRLAGLMAGGVYPLPGLLQDLLLSAAKGLKHYTQQNVTAFPAVYRLAFRELGLAIGLQAPRKITELIRANKAIFSEIEGLEDNLEELSTYRHLQRDIEDFWLKDANRRAESWTSHLDINMVMLATSLLPDGFLGH